MLFNFKDVKVNYTVSGKSGSYILFLHGWGGSIDSFKLHENLLNKKHICINLDFPPFGDSETPHEPWQLDDYCDLVILLLDKLKIKSVNIIAHSFGARVAIMLANRTQLINKLIMTGGAGIKPKKTFKKRLKILKYKFFKLLVKLRLAKKEKLSSFGSEDYKKLSPVMQKTFINIVNKNLKGMLQYINCETLLVWGESDCDTPLYMAKTMNKKIKNSALISYKNSGHFVYLQKFNEFQQIINKFFS